MTHELSSLQAELIELNGKLERIIDGQEAVAADISKIKEAVYNPDEGLYARLRELELWKKNSSRIIWMLLAGGLTLVFTVIKHHVLSIP